MRLSVLGRKIRAMSTSSGFTPPAARPVDEVNEAIRAFMAHRAGRPLFDAEAEQYERLLAAWASAVNKTDVSEGTPTGG